MMIGCLKYADKLVEYVLIHDAGRLTLETGFFPHIHASYTVDRVSQPHNKDRHRCGNTTTADVID